MESSNEITHAEIKAELQNLLEYPALKNCQILCNFLTYIITETLNEKKQAIKEYSIAVNVLKRSADFNSNDDAVVRIHAGRLRRILNVYYLTEGANNSIVISIPKGAYVPEFYFKGTRRLPEVSDDNAIPIVAIFPFKSISQNQGLDNFSIVLCEELSAELSRFHDIVAIGNFSTEVMSKINHNILQAAQFIGADFILTGNMICSNQKLQLRVHLLNSKTGESIMTKLFEHNHLEDIINIQKEIVQNVVSGIGGSFGIVFKEIIKTSPAKLSNNLSIWKGIYSYYKYQRSYSVINYLSGLTILNEAVKLHPDHAATWAMLGEFYLDGVAFGVDGHQDAIEDSYRCVVRALKLDPNCQQTWHSLTWVNLFKRNPDACLKSAEQCIRLNPNASDMVAGVGCMLIFAGYFDEGFKIMDDAIHINASYPWWINIGYSYYYLVKADYENAFVWAEKMDSEETFWDPLLKSVSLSLLEENLKAKKYLNKLLDIAPQTPIEIHGMLSSYILAENTLIPIIESLEKIGLERPFLGSQTAALN